VEPNSVLSDAPKVGLLSPAIVAPVPVLPPDLSTVDFLRRVLPPTGLYVAATPSGTGFKHSVCNSIEELTRIVRACDAAGTPSYYAVAAFKAADVDSFPDKGGSTYKQVRVQRNVRALKTFYMDLDVGDGKGFASQGEAVDKLDEFIKQTKLPWPAVIDSGFGAHLYWPLTTEINPDQWKQTAVALKALCAAHNFRADPAVTSDPARVLRPVGTHNRKRREDVRLVKLASNAPDIGYGEFHGLILAALESAGVNPPEVIKQRETASEKLNDQFAIQRDFPPFSAKQVADQCRQLAKVRDTKGCVQEPHWYGAVQLMVHATEGDDLIHQWSNGYAGYSHAETEGKIAQVRNQNIGPTLCRTFDDRNPGGCEGCPFLSKVTTPASLGRYAPVAPTPNPPTAPSAEESPTATPAPLGITFEIVQGQGPGESTAVQQNDTNALNAIILPSDSYNFSQSALTIFPRFAASGRYFTRAGEPVQLVDKGEAELGFSLERVTAAEFRSSIEKCGCPVLSYIRGDGGALSLKPKLCSKDSAEALLKTEEARKILPAIRLVSRSPVLVMQGGAPKALSAGYHKDLGGVLINRHAPLTTIDLSEAVSELKALISDYKFVTPADKSRALAGIVTPALRMGGLLSENPNGVAHCPVIVAEANESQAGKGYLQQIIRSVYHEPGYLVTQREGGVGSVDESISQALLSGQPFVKLDNFRDRLSSTFLESILTESGTAAVRVPHRGEVQVDMRSVVFQLTSNGVNMTADLANRCMLIRIRKQPDGYKFRQWPRGDLVGHIWDHSAYYLSCVFAVVSAWLAAGRPRVTSGGSHDFREWAGALGWIVEKVFGEAPLLDDHRRAQKQVSNPALIWLREVCLAAERSNQLDHELLASSIAELCQNEGVDVPGLRQTALETQANQQVGRLLAQCFREATTDPDSLSIDGFKVVRSEQVKYKPERQENMWTKHYRILTTVPATPLGQVLL
jgi:hypothetical protein